VHEPFAARIRAQHDAITALAEDAMSHSLAGEPRAAAQALLAAGARTMNAKLIDMARMVLQRHADKIVDAQDLAGTADELKRRYAGGLSVAPLASDNGRQSGGLVLRARDKRAAGGPADPSTAAAVAAKPDAAGTAA
jgi:hypothetical protein